jgi:hypothetical protein
MALVRFNRDWQQFRSGQTVDLPPGKADAVVNYAKAAEYVAERTPLVTDATEEAALLTRRMRGPRENKGE